MKRLPKLHEKSLQDLRKKSSLLKEEDRDLLYQLQLNHAGRILVEDYGHVLSNRDLVFASHYCNPLSDGYRDPLISGRMAGMEEDDAKRVPKADWFKGLQDIINEMFLVSAERRLFEILSMDPREKVITKRHDRFGASITEESERINPGLLRIIADLAKFAAERKGKEEWTQKLTLQHEAGPKTIADLLDHLHNNRLKEDAIDGESVSEDSDGEEREAEEPLLHKGQESEEDPVLAE